MLLKPYEFLMFFHRTYKFITDPEIYHKNKHLEYAPLDLVYSLACIAGIVFFLKMFFPNVFPIALTAPYTDSAYLGVSLVVSVLVTSFLITFISVTTKQLKEKDGVKKYKQRLNLCFLHNIRFGSIANMFACILSFIGLNEYATKGTLFEINGSLISYIVWLLLILAMWLFVRTLIKPVANYTNAFGRGSLSIIFTLSIVVLSYKINSQVHILPDSFTDEVKLKKEILKTPYWKNKMLQSIKDCKNRPILVHCTGSENLQRHPS